MNNIDDFIKQINNERKEELQIIDFHKTANTYMKVAKAMYDEAIINGFNENQACYYAGEYIKQYWKPND